MYSGSNSDNSTLLELVIISVLLIGYLIIFIYKRSTNNRIGPVLDDATDTSIILTMYTSGVILQKIAEGSFQNYKYSLLITSDEVLPTLDTESLGIDRALAPQKSNNLEMGAIKTPEGLIIMKIDLPIVSKVHILGFTTQDKTFQSLLDNSNLGALLTEVNLEGNFPDYFKLYTNKDQEIDIREVLDPTAMAFLIDFCNKMNWELVESSLYFVEIRSSGSQPNNMSTVETAEDFVQKILPTLIRMTIPTNVTQNDKIVS